MNRNKDNREKRGRKGDWQGVRGGCHRVRQGNYVDMSHFSQGLTADHVLIHVDTDLGAKDLRAMRGCESLLSKLQNSGVSLWQ